MTRFRYQSPREAVFLLDAQSVTMEAAKPLLEKHLNTLVPANVKDVQLHLRTEPIQGDFYHYSHGLKHLGTVSAFVMGTVLK